MCNRYPALCARAFEVSYVLSGSNQRPRAGYLCAMGYAGRGLGRGGGGAKVTIRNAEEQGQPRDSTCCRAQGWTLAQNSKHMRVHANRANTKTARSRCGPCSSATPTPPLNTCLTCMLQREGGGGGRSTATGKERGACKLTSSAKSSEPVFARCPSSPRSPLDRWSPSDGGCCRNTAQQVGGTFAKWQQKGTSAGGVYSYDKACHNP